MITITIDNAKGESHTVKIYEDHDENPGCDCGVFAAVASFDGDPLCAADIDASENFLVTALRNLAHGFDSNLLGGELVLPPPTF